MATPPPIIFAPTIPLQTSGLDYGTSISTMPEWAVITIIVLTALILLLSLVLIIAVIWSK